MTRAHLTQYFNKTEELAKNKRALYVDVSVLTESGEREVFAVPDWRWCTVTETCF